MKENQLSAFDILQTATEVYGLADLQSPFPDRVDTMIYFGKGIIDTRFVAFFIKPQEFIYGIYKKSYAKLSVQKT